MSVVERRKGQTGQDRAEQRIGRRSSARVVKTVRADICGSSSASSNTARCDSASANAVCTAKTMSNFETTTNSIVGAPAAAREQHRFGSGLGGGDDKPAVAAPPRHGQPAGIEVGVGGAAAARGPAARGSDRRTAGRNSARRSRNRAADRSSCATAAHRRAARSTAPPARPPRRAAAAR